jgi:hypothetical protein
MARSWNGGTLPVPAVIAARRDHMRMAERPAKVGFMDEAIKKEEGGPLVGSPSS